MHDFTLAVPGVEVFGLDISKYAKDSFKRGNQRVNYDWKRQQSSMG